MKASTKARDIQVYRDEARMEIEWADGHVSSYPFMGLRGVCPCVECRGGHGNMGQAVGPFSMEKEQSPPVALEDASLSGGYGLRISWSDGHSTGIYTWPFLRDLCPCVACRAEAGEEA